ncbi:two-component system response regulator RppA [Myxosarcina sp. GI1]|uniref:two-component system response regulator RppA n=1 Tax=Myxosarcina sp. GI1 TaxID=1541065 RepID=UPI0005635504|nr:two-component system response regulator RppA [Myxosarcina sp. GI1]
MRILLVEDEPDLGAAIERNLHQEAYVVDWVRDGTEAEWYLLSRGQEYTVAIFDWLLPGQTGIELCQKLRDRHNSLPILMLTAKDSIEDRVAGLDAGADDYLVKPFGTSELLARLRALQRRSLPIQPQQLKVGNMTLDCGTHEIYIDKAPKEAQKILLTNKEFQILEYFLRHPDRIITRDLILDRLWEFGIEPTSNVVAAQMRRLRRKLEQYGCQLPIETIYGIGYRLSIKDESK